MPCLRFFLEDLEATTFVMLIQQHAESLDHTFRRIAEEIINNAPGQEVPELVTRARTDGRRAAALISSYERLVSEMFPCRVADNLVAYVADMLALIYRSRPETLGETQVSLKEILKNPDIDNIVALAAEKRIDSLSRDSLEKLSEYFTNQFGIDLFDSEEQKRSAAHLIAVRNLIVHNHRVVDKKFLRQSGRNDLKVGELLVLSEHDLTSWTIAQEAVRGIDKKVAEKYELARPHTASDFWKLFSALRDGANHQAQSDTAVERTDA